MTAIQGMANHISTAPVKTMAEPSVEAGRETSEQPLKQPLPKEKSKLGVALVGLGNYSTNQLAPALMETAYCRLAGVVTGHPDKGEHWRQKYALKAKNIYQYGNFDAIADNKDIDIVYVVLPNALHAEYVVRAARAGKHVICEKPMATTVEDCERMIRACSHAGVKLSIGYRLHFDPFNQEMMRMGQSHVFGSVTDITARHALEVGANEQWRLRSALAGGGALMDLGIYCVQGALYTVGELPLAVKASFLPEKDRKKFREVEEGIAWEMDFPLGVKAVCETAYSGQANLLRAEAMSGWFELQPAFSYSGLKGATPQGRMDLSPVNQQAEQIDDFALCIQHNTPTRVPGEMGLRDLQILTAIYESAKSGRKVELRLKAFQNLIEI